MKQRLTHILVLVKKFAVSRQPHSPFRVTLELTTFVLIVSLTAFLLQPPPVRAGGPWFVSPSGNDNNDCLSWGNACLTIGAAMLKAFSGDTINVAAGTYSANLPQITTNLTIIGANSVTTIVDGGGTATMFHVNTGAVSISNMTIQNGKASSSANQGGGVWNESGGFTTLANVILKSNTAGIGGAVYNAGTMTLTNVTIFSNTAQAIAGTGGGIDNAGVMTLTNVTISNNTAGQGGGIKNDTGSLSLMNVTLSGNAATFTSGGGIFRQGGSVTITNTIVANSTSGGNCSGSFTSSTNNMATDNTCGSGFTQATTTALRLGPLALNLPGTTQTHALLWGSPAINAGTNTGCPAADQRGVTRPVGTTCDIGAYEFNQVNVYFFPFIKK